MDILKHFTFEDAGRRLEDLETPVPVIDIDVVERNLRLEKGGEGSLVILDNRKTSESINGRWGVDGDVLRLDYDGTKTLYLRIVRVTDEKLVIRTDEGKERIYERVK